jgi:hypothetical protein
MGNEIITYTQAARHDWLVTGYRQVDSATQQHFITYEGNAYSPDAKFRCEIPYGTRDLGPALAACDAAADAFVQAPAVVPVEGQDAQAAPTDLYAQQYDLLFRGYHKYAGRITRWLDYRDRTVEGSSVVYYDPSCAPEIKSRELGQCAYIADTDPTKRGMEEFYFPPVTPTDSALLLQGGKRASFVDLINDLL